MYNVVISIFDCDIDSIVADNNPSAVCVCVCCKVLRCVSGYCYAVNKRRLNSIHILANCCKISKLRRKVPLPI